MKPIYAVVLEKHLEGTRITRKGDPYPQVAPSRSNMEAGGRQCVSRSTITSIKTCSANLYRHFKRRVGSLRGTHCKGNQSPSRKKVTNYLELKAVFLALKEFQDLCLNNIVLIATDNTIVVAYINKEGGEVGLSVSHSVNNPDLLLQETGDSQSQTHSRPAECRSIQAIQARPDHPNKVVSPPRDLPINMQQVASTSDRPICYEFETDPVCVTSSRPPGLGSRCTRPTMAGSGLICLPMSSHPGQIVGETVGLPMQENHSDCSRVVQHALVWDLVAMSSQIPLCMPNLPSVLTQPFNQTPHRNLSNLSLHVWLLEPHPSRSSTSLRQWKHELRLLRENQPGKEEHFYKVVHL